MNYPLIFLGQTCHLCKATLRCHFRSSLKLLFQALKPSAGGPGWMLIQEHWPLPGAITAFWQVKETLISDFFFSLGWDLKKPETLIFSNTTTPLP